MHFSPNRRFRKKYDKLFEQDPLTANTFLLLCELADKRGVVQIDPEEIAKLIAIRFEDPREYAL